MSRVVSGLSVVIPCHNAATTLADQLEALTEQDYTGDWEVLVIDNLSSDELSEVVEGFASRLPGLRIVEARDKANLGYARNVGVRHAIYDCVLFCDGDDVVCQEWLSAMAVGLADSDLTTGPLEMQKLNPPHIAASRGAQTSGLQNKFSFLPHGTGGNSGVWREAHEGFGGFDEDMPSLEDTDYFWRAQLAGYHVTYTRDAVIHYRLRAEFAVIMRQASQYAKADVLLHQRYEENGLKRLSLWSGVKGWMRILLSLPILRSSTGRARFAWLLGYRLGRIRGAFAYRVLAL